MKNLDEAFLRAYSKSPSKTHQLPTTSDIVPQAAAVAPRRAAVKNTDHSPELRSVQESISTAVVSKRTAAKSATIRKPSDSASVASTRIDGPDDRYHRIDHVQPQAPDLSVLAPVDSASIKKVKRQPLSEYLAEMRQQMAELEQHSESRDYELMPEYTSSPAPTVSTHQTTKPAVYTYPEVSASKPDNVQPTSEPASSSFVDKRTLRQLASSAGPVVPSIAPAKPSIDDEFFSSGVGKPSSRPANESVNRDQQEVTAVSKHFEPVTVRQSWREAERLFRVDSDVSSVKAPRLPEPPIEKPSNESLTDSTPKTREYPVFKKTEEHAPHSTIDTEYDWMPNQGTASLAMVETLASYSPKSDHSDLYRQAKTATTEKARAEQKLAQSNESIVAPLNPEWEVDAFEWPTTVLELLEAQEKAFEQIASHLSVANGKGLKMIAITSAERGVGKSTTCMCLAALMAHKGLKVAIIDGDAENPSLVNQMNMEISHGWQDCIRANMPLESVAVKAVEEGVTLFPLTDAMSHEELTSSSVKINHLLRRIAKSFDMVFIDTHRISYRSSQLIGTGDNAALDAALVVVDAELSVKDRIDTTLQLLRDQKIGSIGVVENFSNLELVTTEGS